MELLKSTACNARHCFYGMVGLFLVSAFVTSVGCAQTINVVVDKKPCVYLDFDPQLVKSFDLEHQVEDFIDYTQKMTGVKLPMATDPAAKGLVPMKFEYVGPVKSNERFDTRLVQGYEIKVAADKIVIVAHTRLGFMNALYSMLDRWGCRWVMIGTLGDVVPQHDTLTLPVGTIISPKTHNTCVQTSGGAYRPIADWWRRNQGGFEYWMSGQHFWFYAIPEETYFKDHPEWYSLIGGKRVPRQLCTTNPEVIAKMIEVAKQYFKERPEALSFPMDPQDNLDFCQCDKCRAQDPAGTDDIGLPYMTDRVVHFANAVAKGIAKEYPDKVVAFYAYNNHTEPPVNVLPEKNIAVGITRSNYCLLHLLPDKDCPTSIAYYEMVKKWSKICPKIWNYEYDPVSWTGCLPCPIYLERGASIAKLFNEYGLFGGVTDYSPHFKKAYAATYFNPYIERRMKNDPRQNSQEILTDMCKGFFGPAAEPMEKYYLELAKVSEYKHPGRKVVGFGTYRYDEMFNKEMIDNARNYINAAIAAVANKPPYNERVRLVDLSQQYLEAYLSGIWNAKAGNYQKAVGSFERLKSLIFKLNQADAIDVEEATRRVYDTVRLKTLAQYFPQKLGFVTKWKLLGPFDNSKRDASWRDDSFEPIASIDKPVKLKDGSTMQWIDYESPEGLLNVDAFLKDKKLPWKVSYMYAGVRIESKSPRKVQLCMDSFFPYKVFMNGKEIFARLSESADCPDDRVIIVDLPQGTTDIVFKLCQTVYAADAWPWGVYFRIKDMQGKPITDLFK